MNKETQQAYQVGRYSTGTVNTNGMTYQQRQQIDAAFNAGRRDAGSSNTGFSNNGFKNTGQNGR
ncbi:MAG: hypothetical protein H6843_08905 [Rhodospirillaceae bacterium]|nr:hypothetical protein [Rhodospirillaceae bacterium]